MEIVPNTTISQTNARNAKKIFYWTQNIKSAIKKLKIAMSMKKFLLE